jgi:CHASE2 domain-containing sensor protein
MAKRNIQRKTELAAAMSAVLAGWLLLFPANAPNLLVRLSYDLLQLVLPAYRHTDAVIVYIDEQAMQDYKPNAGEGWPRRHHARLLDRLTRDQARVVVFDIAFTQPGSKPAEDVELARAMQRNGRVVLAGAKDSIQGLKAGYTITPPLDLFETNSAGWGTPKLLPEPDGVRRRYESGDDQVPGLIWSAARAARAPVAQHPEKRLNEERWLNYYGSSRPFVQHSMTYSRAEAQETNFFRDKTVLIGGQPETLAREDRPDVFRTPFTRWNNLLIPGVELTAIAYANLVHGDSLYRTGFWIEFTILLATGLLTGLALQRLPRRAAAWYVLLLVVLVVGAVLKLLLTFHIWFPWLVILLAQLPCALAFRLASKPAPVSVPVLPDTQLEGTATTQGNEIGEHLLMRCVGEGAYGQVWIGRNAIGLYHAVKIIYRSRFSVEAPYERALRGIQKFMPISRSHEGFVHILHVGRNDTAGHFFYIMEAGDDEKTAQNIDPATYAPKTLASELRQRRALPPSECLQLMLSLTEATDHLHQHQLIHRDIKPPNIIFVNHHPKLADIDLVTDLAATGEVSRIGTEGYLAPEGPGSAAADVFSLGRILYVALTGKRPDMCPELPTDFSQRPDCELFLSLIQIACKACESDLTRRYSSALLMRTDLLHVSTQLSPKEPAPPRA